MDYIKIRNWEKWQTYRKDRGQPPWIKVHRKLMRKPKWVALSDAERGQLVAIWMLAADRDGAIPASAEIIQKLCFMEKPPDLNKFTDLGFIENGWRQGGVKVASSGCQYDQPKAETEKRREEEKKPESFALPSQEEITESSIPKIKSDIEKACKDLYERGVFPKANAFTNKCFKMKCNPRAVLHTLVRVNNAKPKDPWAYAVKIMQVEDGNFNERDFRKTT